MRITGESNCLGIHSTCTSLSPAPLPPSQGAPVTAARAGDLGHTQHTAQDLVQPHQHSKHHFPPLQASPLCHASRPGVWAEPVSQRQISQQPRAVSTGFAPRREEALDRSFIVQPNTAETRPGAVQSKNKKVTGTPHIIYISASNGSIGNKGIQALERECLAVK